MTDLDCELWSYDFDGVLDGIADVIDIETRIVDDALGSATDLIIDDALMTVTDVLDFDPLGDVFDDILTVFDSLDLDALLAAIIQSAHRERRRSKQAEAAGLAAVTSIASCRRTLPADPTHTPRHRRCVDHRPTPLAAITSIAAHAPPASPGLHDRPSMVGERSLPTIARGTEPQRRSEPEATAA